MIKLEDIKAGDEVQIANGDWFEVVEVERFQLVVNEGISISKNFITDHRPEFDWSTAKSGMCFKRCSKVKQDLYQLIWFVGMDFDDKNWGVFSTIKDCDEFESLRLSDVIRHQEGDIDNE